MWNLPNGVGCCLRPIVQRMCGFRMCGFRMSGFRMSGFQMCGYRMIDTTATVEVGF